MRSASLVGGLQLTGGSVKQLVSPADTSRVVGEVEFCGPDAVETAIANAVKGQRDWAAVSPMERGAIVDRAASLLQVRAEETAMVVTEEEGKPLWESRGEVTKSIDTFRYYGALGRDLDGRALAGSRLGLRAHTVPFPVGVCVLITPWNVPVVGPARKLAPALVAGNACVLKPASITPGAATILVEVLLEAGVPPAVVQLLHGGGGEIGEVLARDPRVAAVTFTGSTEVGHRLRQVIPPGTRLQAELGGKNPLVVTADADLELAVDLIVRGGLASTGQMCTATSRVVVQESIEAELTDRLIAACEKLVIGPGDRPDTWMGPLVSRSRLDEVEAHVGGARERGLNVWGGKRPGGGLADGYFYSPAVVSGASSADPIAQDEVFGPVLTVLTYDAIDRAIEIANDTRYGLSAAICTRDIDAATAFTERVEAGVVGVNVPTAGIDLHYAFGGVKASGMGTKEQGREGLEFFLVRRTVITAPHGAPR